MCGEYVYRMFVYVTDWRSNGQDCLPVSMTLLSIAQIFPLSIIDTLCNALGRICTWKLSQEGTSVCNYTVGFFTLTTM